MSTKLGPCCICETTRNVRNVIMLDKRCPTPGHGWGCVVCGLPSDGASAVLCDACFEAFADKKAALKFACRGYPATDGRIPLAELKGQHKHDMSKHPEEQ